MSITSKNSILTDIKKAKGLGAAHSGTHHWMLQRITAILNIPLIFWAVYSIFKLQGASYEEFTIWLSSPIQAFVAILFIINTFLHAKLGLEEIMTDYISCKWFRLFKIISMKIFFLVLGLAAIFSILKIAFMANL